MFCIFHICTVGFLARITVIKKFGLNQNPEMNPLQIFAAHQEFKQDFKKIDSCIVYYMLMY